MYIEHDIALKRINARPALIGIENVVWSAVNVMLYNSRQVMGEIDFVAYTAGKYDKPYWVVEYKYSDRKRDKALKQIERGKDFVWRTYKEEAHGLFVWDPEKFYNELV